MRIVCLAWNVKTFSLKKIKTSSAAVVIGALRNNCTRTCNKSIRRNSRFKPTLKLPNFTFLFALLLGHFKQDITNALKFAFKYIHDLCFFINKVCVFHFNESAKKTCIWKCRLFMSSAEYSCKLFKPIFAYTQTVWTQIRLLLEEQSDLGPHYLQKWLLKSQADDKADDYCCDWQFKC